jgi:hypothetical protein
MFYKTLMISLILGISSICYSDDLDELRALINSEIYKLGNSADLNHIDVSEYTHLDYLFLASDFNGDISLWDISNVTSLEGTFSYSKFNGDVSLWDISNVKNFLNVFGESEFKGDVSLWPLTNYR